MRLALVSQIDLMKTDFIFHSIVTSTFFAQHVTSFVRFQSQVYVFLQQILFFCATFVVFLCYIGRRHETRRQFPVLLLSIVQERQARITTWRR